MSVQQPILVLNKLKKYFPVRGSGNLKALEDVSLQVFEGEKFGVVGESGCGKSTLGRVILQLYRQTSGACVYFGRSLQDVSPRYLGREIKSLPKYQKRAKRFYQKSLETDLRAHAVGMKLDEVSAQANQREIKKYRKLSRHADLLAFRARELRKEASRQLREGSRTVGSMILCRDLMKIRALYESSHQSLIKANKVAERLSRTEAALREAKLEGVKPDPRDETRFEEERTALQRYEEAAQASIKAAEAFRHQNICRITERCDDPKYWEKLDGNQETGVNLGKLTNYEMRTIRRDLQMIFQDPAASLDPRETAGKAIEESFRINTKLGKEGRKEKVLELLRDVGLKEEHYHSYPHQLSGGQKQRVGIARAIALNPKFVVLDESVSALDVSVQAQILLLLNNLQKKYGLTYFFITHNLGVVKHFCDRVMVMYLGGICELGTTKDLFRNPLHPYTRSLLASVPRLGVREGEMEEFVLKGEVPSAVNPPSGCTFHTRCTQCMGVCKLKKPVMQEVLPNQWVACHLYSEGKEAANEV